MNQTKKDYIKKLIDNGVYENTDDLINEIERVIDFHRPMIKESIYINKSASDYNRISLLGTNKPGVYKLVMRFIAGHFRVYNHCQVDRYDIDISDDIESILSVLDIISITDLAKSANVKIENRNLEISKVEGTSNEFLITIRKNDDLEYTTNITIDKLLKLKELLEKIKIQKEFLYLPENKDLW